MQLTQAQQDFILHWGEMGAKWGVNRTVAQIHALLFLAERPLDAEEIVETLSVARSNVSTSLKELQGWGLVKSVRPLGERRDHFESLKDVWSMFRIVLEERKKREVDPTLAVLRECVNKAEADPDESEHVRAQLREMLSFFERTSDWYEQIQRLPNAHLHRLLSMGGDILKMMEKVS